MLAQWDEEVEFEGMSFANKQRDRHWLLIKRKIGRGEIKEEKQERDILNKPRW